MSNGETNMTQNLPVMNNKLTELSIREAQKCLRIENHCNNHKNISQFFSFQFTIQSTANRINE